MHAPASWLLLPLVGLAACAGNDPSTPTDGTDPTGDTGAATSDCLDQWADGLTEPDASGPDTQIHGTSVFDGTHVWVAWNRPDAGSKFDIFLQRMTCDGQVDLGPFEVTDTDDNELDPVLAVSGGRLLVAWTSDSDAVHNLDIRTRVYDLDGNALTEPADLEASRNGAVVTGNATLPHAAPRDGGFWLAGSWGHEKSPAFQAFAVPLDLDGLPIEDATDGEVDAVFGQTYVSVAEGGGEARLVWQEDSVDSVEPTLVGGALGDAAEIVRPGARPEVAYGPSGWWTVWDTDDGDVQVLPPGGTISGLGGRMVFHHSPSLVVTDEGALVLAMEVVDGVANALKLWQLDTEGEVVHEQMLQTQGAISVYGVDLVAIDDKHVVVVYQDGPSPAFRVKAEWITLP